MNASAAVSKNTQNRFICPPSFVFIPPVYHIPPRIARNYARTDCIRPCIVLLFLFIDIQPYPVLNLTDGFVQCFVSGEVGATGVKHNIINGAVA